MMKQILIVVFAILTTIAYAQEETPETITLMGGEGTISFSNTGFGEYYAGGGLGSTTVGAGLNTYVNKKYTNNATWDNSLRLDYGIAKVDNLNGDNFTKSSDVIDVISKYGTPIRNNDKWFYSAAFNLLTQLTDTHTAYDESLGDYTALKGINGGNFGTVQSTLFSPADISLGLGLDYKPNDHFSAFIGPLTGKIRVIGDDLIAQSGLFGNEVNYNSSGVITDYENTRLEAGASALANYKNKFLHDDMLSFTTGLKLFSNYIEDPQNVDVNWNTTTSLNPWKFITITYTTDLAYDDNKTFTSYADGEPTNGLHKGIQFRNVLGIGLIHKFGDSK